MTFQIIAEYLNKKKIETVRGKKFRGAHVHSILKKRQKSINFYKKLGFLSIHNSFKLDL